MGNTLREQLEESLNGQGALPYLFIGSGLSRRYLALPDWGGLVREFCEQAGQDYDYVRSSNGNLYPEMASHIAEPFYEHWWKAEEYTEQREQYKSQAVNKEWVLKLAVSRYLDDIDKLDEGKPGFDDKSLNAEVEALREAVVEGVVTTNYDSLAEQIFPDYKAYVGQDELLLGDAQYVGETYKIHGCTSRPESLVLTADDYKRFNDSQKYMAAKLLTIFAEHPVVFVGYSLSDEYIMKILEEIAQAVGPKRIDELGKRLYFVEWNPDPTYEPRISTTSIGGDGTYLPITRIDTYSFQWIWEALGSLERALPAAILREVKASLRLLVDQVAAEGSMETVASVPIDSEKAKDLKIVFGVGAYPMKDLEELSVITGRILTIYDLFDDLLELREKPLSAENVLTVGIPEQVRPPKNSYVPVWKYLSEAGRIRDDGSVDYEGLPGLIKKLAEKAIAQPVTSTLGRVKACFGDRIPSVEEVLDLDEKLYTKLYALQLVAQKGGSEESLKDALATIYADRPEGPDFTGLRKAICALDRKLYRPPVIQPQPRALFLQSSTPRLRDDFGPLGPLPGPASSENQLTRRSAPYRELSVKTVKGLGQC